MPVSEVVKQGMSSSSWIRRMFEEGMILKQRHGADRVFDLSLGNPVMEPPAEFKTELRQLTENPIPGMHRYMENAGYVETRSAVASQLATDTGIKYTAGNIIMTCGAAAALNVVLKTILNAGDNVIIFAPYFPEYLHYIRNHYGVPRILSTDENFVPKLDSLEAGIDQKTRAIIINSPNNPSGVVYHHSFLAELGRLLERKSSEFGSPVYLISDEPYRRLVYDGIKFVYPSQHYSNSIIVNSYSKDLSIPGERIGYIALHPECHDRAELFDGLVFCNRTLGFVNAPALMQHAIRRLQAVHVSVAEYQRRRDFLYQNLKGMGYSLIKPQGAFYLFPKTPIPDDVAFVRELQKHFVLTVPGQGFGTPGYFRISYCVDDRTLEGSLEGFQKVARRFGLC